LSPRYTMGAHMTDLQTRLTRRNRANGIILARKGLEGDAEQLGYPLAVCHIPSDRRARLVGPA